MKPILYEKHKRTFTNDYIGILIDVISCFVEEERNGMYELEMVYPVNGAFYSDIEQDAIIKAKPNAEDDPQPFRIYKITKMMNGTVMVNARHIVYDLSKVTVEPFSSTGTISDAIQGMIDHSNPSCGFIFETNKTTAGNYNVLIPSSFRALMGGVRGSLLDVFGTGEYHYDEYNISLNLTRGMNRGIVIRYGVNLIDMEQEEACDNVYTAVFPFYKSETTYIYLDERIISVGQYPFSRVMALDLSSEFDNTPTKTQLRDKAQQYINENNIGVPDVSLEVDFTGTEIEQDVRLCDTVSVEFEKIGVSATAKCIYLKYDVIRERVSLVRLGSYKNTFIDTVYNEMRGITQDTTLNPTDIENAITDIARTNEGYLILHSSDNTDHTDELLILTETDKLNLVQKLWRMNKNGIGFSSNGYSGSYETAITAAGYILASFIKTGMLRALRINHQNDNFYVTPQGLMHAKSGYIGSTTTGFHIEQDQLYNTNIRLYNLGVAIKNSNGKELGTIGKTIALESRPISFPVEYGGQIYNSFPRNIVDGFNVNEPGIGLIMSKQADRTGFYYWDGQAGYNKSIMLFYKFSSTQLPQYRSDWYLDDSVNVYFDLNMNNNEIVINPAHSFGHTEFGVDQYRNIWNSWCPYVDGNYLKMNYYKIDFTGFGVEKERHYYRFDYYPDGHTAVDGFEIIVGVYNP